MLRDEILDAATQLLLDTNDATAVSIRSVAGRVGVTAPSIYLHFADKAALLEAVCVRYFESLDEQMQQAAAGEPTTLDRLRAQGLAYVRFAIGTPELYRIAIGDADEPGGDLDAVLTGSAFTHMRGSVQALIDEGVFPPGDPTAVALELWSAAHGVASLLIDKPYLPFGDAEAFTDRVLRSICLGHIVAGMAAEDLGDDPTPQQLLDWVLARGGRS